MLERNRRSIRWSGSRIGIDGTTCARIMLCVLVFVVIFNKNKYHAAMAFTLYPILFSFALVFAGLLMQKKIHLMAYETFIILLISCVTAFSTLTSSVVNWTNNTTCYFVSEIIFLLAIAIDFDQKSIVSILHFYASITLLISLWALANYLTGNCLVDGRVSVRILGVLKDQNYLSAYLSFGAFYYTFSFFFGSQKKRYLLAGIVIVSAIYLTGSRGGLISALVPLVIAVLFSLFKGKFTAAKLLSYLFAVGLVVIFMAKNSALFSRMSDAEGYTDNIRLTIWNYALDGFRNSPLIGSGIQSGTYYSQLHVRWYTHSCFVDMITSIGLIGCFLFILLFAKLILVKRSNIVFLLSMFIGMLLPLMFINGYETITFWVPLTLLTIASRYCKESSFTGLLI